MLFFNYHNSNFKFVEKQIYNQLKNKLKIELRQHKLKVWGTNEDWIINLGVNLVKNWKFGDLIEFGIV
jgi:hypothetical protein